MDEPDRTIGEDRKHISARDARGGEIVLRRRWMRIIFIAGLIGLALLAIVLSY